MLVTMIDRIQTDSQNLGDGDLVNQSSKRLASCGHFAVVQWPCVILKKMEEYIIHSIHQDSGRILLI